MTMKDLISYDYEGSENHLISYDYEGSDIV